MADGADLSIDSARLDRDVDRMVRQYLSAGTMAVGRAARRIEKQLEAATQNAVPGRLWRAWASESYPRQGPARNPSAEVFVKRPAGRRSIGAMTFWSQPGEIRGSWGQFLAIPLPAAGPRDRKRNLTPGEWERRTGQRLRFVYRRGRASLLVADGAVFGRGGVARPLTELRAARDGKRGRRRYEATIPIFALMPVVKFRNTLAIEPIVRAGESELPIEFLHAVRALR